MPPKDNTYTITKVDYDFNAPTTRVPKFVRMPELYLELLVNKKKVDHKLASEKYSHVYNVVVSSDNDVYPPVKRITSRPPSPVTKLPHSPKIADLGPGTFNWESDDSMEQSPMKRLTKKLSPLDGPRSVSIGTKHECYKRLKRSITKSYYDTFARTPPEGRRPAMDAGTSPTQMRGEGNPPPPLKEIKKTYGGHENPRITRLEENMDGGGYRDEDDAKRELLFKFNRLRKTYPKVDMPEFNMMSNLDTVKLTYNNTVKNLAIDSTVETYKSYLMMGFFGCEIVLGKIGFDMEGYSQQQTLYMSKYDKLLIELGEKSYVPSSINKWPVEIRLMVLVLFQTTIFVVSKIIAKKTNVNVLQMYNNINGVYNTDSPKRKVEEGLSSSGFVSGGSSPLTFIPRKPQPAYGSRPTSVTMRGPSSASRKD